MDYEKKYKEALDWMRSVYPTMTGANKEDAEHFFPELKESEDERIRKGIVKYLEQSQFGEEHYCVDDDIVRDYIAWLEKQGESTDINPSEFDLRLNKLLKQFETLSKEELTNSLSFYLNVVQNDGTYREEKQGKQKPVVIIPKFRVGDEIKTANEEPLTITEITDSGYWSEDLFICSFEDSAKWKLVNVEPKFHKGDWITNGDYTWKIVEIKPLDYILQSQDGNIVDDTISHVDEQFHSFTIEDAKDGDVLFTSSTASHETFIFKSIDEKGNAKCYFAYDSEDGFREGKYHFIGSATNCKLATKEQRDLLFQKMHEAGYEWDAEKEELKKIEQKPAWSEEDEKQARQIERIVHDDGCTQKLQKQIADWFKSLKERCNWKPSDEQMDALRYVTNFDYGGYKATLVSLYEQLKKLKDEK